jgi:putative copper export protein
MLLVLARGLFVACALSGFGAALFALTVPITGHVNARGRSSIERQVRKVISLSLAAALVFGYAWLLLETHALAGTTDLAQTMTAIPAVLFDTRFGQVLALQTVAIAGALIAAWRRRGILAAALAGTAVMLEAGHSHAFAMAHIPLLLSQMLHLTAAGAWLGGLLPFLIVVLRRRWRRHPLGDFLPSARFPSPRLPPPRSCRERCFRVDLQDSPEPPTARCCC